MTLPYQRTYTITNVREFLRRLALPPSAGGYKGIRRDIRREAIALLRHYPMDCEIDEAAKLAPRVFARSEREVTP